MVLPDFRMHRTGVDRAGRGFLKSGFVLPLRGDELFRIVLEFFQALRTAKMEMPACMLKMMGRIFCDVHAAYGICQPEGLGGGFRMVVLMLRR